jgi:hypothetical protein
LLASLLRRLRRATAIESGLLQMQNNLIRQAKQERLVQLRTSHCSEAARVRLVGSMPGVRPDVRWDDGAARATTSLGDESGDAQGDHPPPLGRKSNAEIANCFQRLANDVPKVKFDALFHEIYGRHVPIFRKTTPCKVLPWRYSLAMQRSEGGKRLPYCLKHGNQIIDAAIVHPRIRQRAT